MKNILLIAFAIVLLINFAQAGNYYMLNINKVSKQYDFEIEIGDDLLVYTEEVLPYPLKSNINANPRLVIINKMKLCGADELEQYQTIQDNDLFIVLFKRYGYVVMQARDQSSYNSLLRLNLNNKNIRMIVPASTRTTLLQNAKPNLKAAESNYIKNLVTSVNQTRLSSVVQGLAQYNRYSLGTDIINARDYIINHIRAINPSIPVTTEIFTVSGKTCYNVVATLTGHSQHDRWYIIGAHYDSTSQSPNTLAPGAEDNASGSSGILEILRILNNNPPQKGTFKFIWYAGEEQGLYGSKANVNDLIKNGDKSKVVAALTHDMIGYRKTNNGVIIETSKTNVTLFDPVLRGAIDYTPGFTYRIDTNPFGSDHVSYLNAGIPATLAIDMDWADYPYYHRTTDTPDKLDYEILNSITRFEVATLALISENTH